MAKNMARIENGIVVNVEWCSDRTADTDTLISVYDRPVTAGDQYIDGKFYRDGKQILTPLEDAEKALANSIPVADLEAAYQEGVNSAYD